MSDLFDKAALGFTAYKAYGIKQEASKQTAFAQAQLELEQLRTQKEDEQQYLRDTIFKIHTVLTEHLPALTPQQRLYWAAFYNDRLMLENVTADRFSSIADKKAASEILQAFKATCAECVDAVGKEEGDALVNCARLCYAVPLLERLANLFSIRDRLPTAMGLHLRRIKARCTGFVIGGAAGAILGAIFISESFFTRIFIGAFMGMLFIGGGLITFAEGRLTKLFMPKDWEQMVALADESGVNLGIKATQEELDGITSQIESELPAVSEKPDSNSLHYKARYEAAVDFIKTTQERFLIA